MLGYTLTTIIVLCALVPIVGWAQSELRAYRDRREFRQRLSR